MQIRNVHYRLLPDGDTMAYIHDVPSITGIGKDQCEAIDRLIVNYDNILCGIISLRERKAECDEQDNRRICGDRE